MRLSKASWQFVALPDKFFRFSVDKMTKASTSWGKVAIKSFGSMLDGKRHIVNFNNSLCCGGESSSKFTYGEKKPLKSMTAKCIV